MVLGKLPVLGRPTNLDECRARGTALAVGAGGGMFGYFFFHLFFFSFFLPLSVGDGPI